MRYHLSKFVYQVLRIKLLGFVSFHEIEVIVIVSTLEDVNITRLFHYDQNKTLIIIYFSK